LWQVMVLGLVLAEGDDGYLYGKPSGERLQEIKPENCGTNDPKAHAASLAAYRDARPQPRRIYKHQEKVVDSSFFKPSKNRIDELKRVLLDQE
ncbi:hypothetical protein KR009_004593, partial [Drosophila setifemur]